MRLASITIYPVKSVRGVSLTEAMVLSRGLEGDRRWMLVRPDGHFVTQRERSELARLRCEVSGNGIAFESGPEVHPKLDWSRKSVRIWADEVSGYVAPKAISDWLGAQTGLDLDLVWMGPDSVRPANPDYARPTDEVSFADGMPVLVVTEASLEAVNARLGEPVPMTRFRPNLVIHGAGSFEEDRWRRIRVGAVELELVKPCERCVMVDTDMAGERRPGVLRELATFRRVENKVYFGQNAVPRGEGMVRVGDAVSVIESGPARPALDGQ